tara:strand:+ start:4902 stop:5258 length:357 start_codon:yes stop_codon:yes gene_type:complete
MSKQQIKTLNRKHTMALKKFMVKIDETIYKATDSMPSKKYMDFQLLKERAIVFSNEISIDYIEKEHEQEWIMMLPNFMIFGVVGFLTGVNNGKADFVPLIDELYEFHFSMIDEFQDII